MWRWLVNFTPQPLYPWGVGRPGEPQGRSGRCGEKRKVLVQLLCGSVSSFNCQRRKLNEPLLVADCDKQRSLVSVPSRAAHRLTPSHVTAGENKAVSIDWLLIMLRFVSWTKEWNSLHKPNCNSVCSHNIPTLFPSLDQINPLKTKRVCFI
jgi:hypothetical protein